MAAISNPQFSFEVLPPLKGMGTEKLFSSIEKLIEFNPKCINITTHRSETIYRLLNDNTYKKVDYKRRPGTVAVASAIKNQFKVNVVPHILCSGYTKEETEYALLDLQFLGITDLLILRGDKAKEDPIFKAEQGGHSHAVELARQVSEFNKGFFADGTEIKSAVNPFHFGVAGYPEKHSESPNLDQDILYLKEKVDAGAEYVVTQLFYDNKKFFEFEKKAREVGIKVPIIPGIKPLYKFDQLQTIPNTFKCDIPLELSSAVSKCKSDAEIKAIGKEWCVAQCKELLAHGVPGLHFYTVGAVDTIREIAAEVY